MGKAAVTCAGGCACDPTVITAINKDTNIKVGGPGGAYTIHLLLGPCPSFPVQFCCFSSCPHGSHLCYNSKETRALIVNNVGHKKSS